MTQKKQTLNDKLKKLEQIADFFKKEDFDIDNGMKYYEEGMKLSKEISDILTSYNLKIQEIKEKYSDDNIGEDLK